MSRLKQLHPSNYGFQGNTSSEFENVIRYLNAAEIGNFTVAELLKKLFDSEGNFDGPVKFRFDAGAGIEYRIGEYLLNGVPQPEVGWKLLVSANDLRGPAGVNYGSVNSPVSATRVDWTAAAGQTDFDLTLDDSTLTIVYVNGVLQRVGASNDYTHDTLSSPTKIVFNSGLTVDDEVTAFRVTEPFVEGYVRSDWDVDTDRTVFAFALEPTESPLVYHNGILQREGVSSDYTLDAASNQIIFNSVVPSGDDVSAILIKNEAQDVVAGLMLEKAYVDPATGNILGSKVQYEDNGLPQAKVDGLATAIALMASAEISETQPSPETLFWLDTGTSPAIMKYWDGTQYLPTSGNTGLPSFAPADAGLFVKINGTGTGYTYGQVDLSGLIPTSQRGAANGVATLDANGRLTDSQVASPRNKRVIWRRIEGSVADGDYQIGRLFLEENRIVGFIGVLDGGTASCEVFANGVSVSSAFSLSVSITETALGSPVTIDSISASTSLSVTISSASTASGLEVGVVVEAVN